MIIGVVKETYPGEQRCALVPASVPPLSKAGFEVVVEAGTGAAAGYPDHAFQERGCTISQRAGIFARADIILQVRSFGANPEAGAADLALYRKGQILIGMFDPLSSPALVRQVAECGVTAFSMELMPRITRAQSMDVLSSMATVAGYKAALLAAIRLPRMFPMLMTAAGTITPAKVFVIGAGVAGLQAIATAKRMGAVVSGYDVRPAVKDQVQSLGAKFVELPLETGEAEDSSGYAREQSQSFLDRQRAMMARVVAESDVVISTAAIPGKTAPLLITREMVEGMAPGSIIVDLAAERGGNCELTQPDEVVEHHGVTILGPLNLASSVPYHASQMYARNLATFLLHIGKNGQIDLDRDDQILRETMITRDGAVVNERLKEILGVHPAPSGN